jgi:hypothetical protein
MQGTASVLRRLDAIKDALNNGVPKALERHVNDIADNMNQQYANYSYEDDDAYVYTEKLPNGFNIVSAGEDFFFVEFGTGLFYSRSPIPHPFNEPASWSATHAQYLTDPKKFAKYHGYWPYNGRWTSGQPAANVFYEAGKEVEFSTTPVVSAEIGKAFK